MSLIIRGWLIAKAHCSIMRALGLIVGTMSRAHCAINHNEGNNEPNNEANCWANSVFISLKTQATPLLLLTRTATVRTNPGGRPRISLGRVGGALVLGLDARRARRQVREAMPH